ncbi:MAG: nuclear transport factor 2 family protein [Eubacteriales bacterium]
MDIQGFWNAVLSQDRENIRRYFSDDAYIAWHCTNELFTVEEFIRANCEYPGEWAGEIEREEKIGALTVTVVRVYSKCDGTSFHVTSFIKTDADKIVSLDEYWADDDSAPEWRRDMHIGRKIK